MKKNTVPVSSFSDISSQCAKLEFFSTFLQKYKFKLPNYHNKISRGSRKKGWNYFDELDRKKLTRKKTIDLWKLIHTLLFVSYTFLFSFVPFKEVTVLIWRDGQHPRITRDILSYRKLSRHPAKTDQRDTELDVTIKTVHKYRLLASTSHRRTDNQERERDSLRSRFRPMILKQVASPLTMANLNKLTILSYFQLFEISFLSAHRPACLFYDMLSRKKREQQSSWWVNVLKQDTHNTYNPIQRSLYSTYYLNAQ